LCGKDEEKQKILVILVRINFSAPSFLSSRRMRWAGHVARMGRRGMHIEYWWESQKERDH
jgi:hypothetical protein